MKLFRLPAFGLEVADVVRRAISIRPCGRRVEDVPGGVVVEDRPDDYPGVTGGTRGETEDPDGIAAGKALTCVGRAGGIDLVLNQGDLNSPLGATNTRFRFWTVS